MYGTETKEILNDDGAINKKFKEEIYDSTIPAGSKTGVKRQRRTKPKSKLVSQHPPGILDGCFLGHLIPPHMGLHSVWD